MLMDKKTAVPGRSSSPDAAFATMRSHRLAGRVRCFSAGPRFVPTRRRPTSSNVGARMIPRRPDPSTPTSTRLFALHGYQGHHISALVPSLAFLPPADYLHDPAAFVVGLSLMFLAASYLVSKPQEDREKPSPADTDGEILTPETYADARSAKRRVKDTISRKAMEAFDSTDFAHEPRLSPEIEDAEAAYEIALVAEAAHGMAEAAVRESRQSRAAMLERERELEWIETRGEEDARALRDEVLHRSLLAARIANDAIAVARRRERFQRSLLSARIAEDAGAREQFLERHRKEDWIESEARVASIGGQECLPFAVASAAAVAAAHALEEAEVETEEMDTSPLEIAQAEVGVVAEGETDDALGEGEDVTPPAVAASMVAEATERMILGEDIAFFEHSPESTAQLSETSKKEPPAGEIDAGEPLPEVDQWRKDYVREKKSVVQAGGAEWSKETKSSRCKIGAGGLGREDGTLESADPAAAALSNELGEKLSGPQSESVIKKAIERGFVRRVRERRRLLIVAAAVVISRRLFLAYFGKGWSLL